MYCPTYDFYITKFSIAEFLDKDSVIGNLRFEKNAQGLGLSYEDRETFRYILDKKVYYIKDNKVVKILSQIEAEILENHHFKLIYPYQIEYTLHKDKSWTADYFKNFEDYSTKLKQLKKDKYNILKEITPNLQLS